MTKTEQAIIEGVKAKGYFVAVGKRMFDAAKKLQADGTIPGARFSFDCYNANGVEFRSQWNSPRSRTAYEIAVRVN